MQKKIDEMNINLLNSERQIQKQNVEIEKLRTENSIRDKIRSSDHRLLQGHCLSPQEYIREKDDVLSQYIMEVTDKDQQIRIMQKKLNEVRQSQSLEIEKLRAEICMRDQSIHQLKQQQND